MTMHRTKKKAKELAERSPDAGHTRIYTDGSGINKKVEVVVVVPSIEMGSKVYLSSTAKGKEESIW